MIICCDGTNNQFGSNNTNVVRLIQVLDRDPEKQLVYYDPGVGTMPEPGFVTPVGKWISKVFGLAFGAGLAGKIGIAYKFLMDHYETGDQIYLYGFSRGAYTVRALAGVIHQFGLLPAGNDNLIPYVLRYSKSISKLKQGDKDAKEKYWKVSRQFRETFARIQSLAGRGTRTVQIHFLGVWDTISSVGWVWEPVHFPYTTSNPDVDVVRHAISLDEHRAFFRQNRWFKPKDSSQNVWEVWFPGVHSDVGGGYAEKEGGLWRTPFLWMVRESEQNGLIIRRGKVREVLKRTPAIDSDMQTADSSRESIPRPPWANKLHESLTWKWWIAEFFPKLRKNRDTKTTSLRFNLFRRRVIQKAGKLADGTEAKGAEMHRSLLRRIRRAGLGYEPPNLSKAFRDHVKNLERVPATLAYHDPPQ